MDRMKDYCDICNVKFSGTQPALQHFSSEKHKKKERQRQCAHENVQSQRIQERLDNIPEKEYEMTGYKGICYVCNNMELTSKVVASQHLAGKSHKKAKERWEQRKQEQDFLRNSKPTIVGTLSSGALNNAIKENNLLPKLKVKVGSETRKFDSEPVSSKCYTFDVSLRKGYCFACGVELKDFKILQKHLKEAEHLSNEKEWSKSPDTTRQIPERMDDSRTASTPSPPCPPAVSVYPSNPLDNTRWYLCEVCDVRVNTPNQLKIHQQSPKHIKQTERRRSGVVLSQGQADQTIWYFCDVCDKKLNSQDQLVVHRRSHGIKDELPSCPVARTPINTGQGSARRVLDVANDDVDHKFDLDLSPQDEVESPLPASKDMRDSVREQRLRYFGRQLQTPQVTENYELDLTKTLQSLDLNKAASPISPTPPVEVKSSNWSQGWLVKSKSQSSITSNKSDETSEVVQESKDQVVPNSANKDSPEPSPKISDAARIQECKIFGCTNHCDLCDKHHTGAMPYKQHLKSKGHLKKQAEADAENKMDEGKPFPTFQHYCELCQVPFDTESSAEAHYQGKKHTEKLIRASKAPERDLEAIRKDIPAEECESPYDLICTVPRSYQVELYEKAMEQDVVCFLPTGTGKTLVSVMVVSHMLQLNPYRPVVFLVDKVLLAIQQCKVIKAELEDKEFDRYDDEEKKIIHRRPRISLVYGGKQETHGRPIWQQDVVVATAAYFENLLMRSIVRWEDHCLIVLDESHHCVKDHPYQRVMRDYHTALPDISTRPKVLGLTASPAGRHDERLTKIMLEELLMNLGNVRMAAVEHDRRELEKYSSNTKLIIKKVNLSDQEERFKVELQKYILLCYQRLVAETNIEDYLQNKEMYMQLDAEMQDNISMELVQDIIDVIDNIEAKGEGNKIYVESLKSHAKVISSTLVTVRSLGVNFAWEDIEALNKDAHPGSFSHAKEMGLKCEPLMQTLEAYRRHRSMPIDAGDDVEVDSMPVVKQLIHEIINEVDWNKGIEDSKDRPMVLVLVRQRKYAKSLETILSEVPQLVDRNIRSVCVVGHAVKASDGMSVRHQHRVMSEIQQRQYQIIVGTSIAEEGLDFPECELVIQMDPPNNVKSLVQIRGRARKKNSRFVALCRDDSQVKSLESLQLREGYMITAVNDIVREQNQLPV